MRAVVFATCALLLSATSYAQHAAFPFPRADQIVLSVFERSVREIKIFVRRGGEFGEHFVRAEAD